MLTASASWIILPSSVTSTAHQLQAAAIQAGTSPPLFGLANNYRISEIHHRLRNTPHHAICAATSMHHPLDFLQFLQSFSPQAVRNMMFCLIYPWTNLRQVATGTSSCLWGVQPCYLCARLTATTNLQHIPVAPALTNLSSFELPGLCMLLPS
jgi:hypothetical protein